MPRRRFLFLALLSMIFYFVVLFRLLYLQVFKRSYFTELSKRNYLRLKVLYPQRGEILDRNGERIAYDIPKYVLFLDPQKLEDPNSLNELLIELKNLFEIDIRESNLREKMKGFEPIPIKTLESQEEIDKFYNNSYKLPGVFINMIPQRYYPYGEITSHITGYTGYPTDEDLKKYKERVHMQSLIGKYGAERAFDEFLLGFTGGEEVMINAVGKPVKVVRTIVPKKGNTVVLTVDVRIQRILYEIFSKSGHKAGGILLIHAKTGEVLGMLSYPCFDPNTLSEKWQEYFSDPYKPLFNRCLFAKYPPASVIKPALAVALLEKGLSIREGVVCNGRFELGNRIFYCWNRHGHGWENVKTAIRDSCDVFFYNYGYYKLGPKGIEEILRGFSYGEGIPFELPCAKGFIPTPAWKRKRLGDAWYGGDTVNLSIGQGYITATLLEQVLMMSGIVNNGVIYKPTLIREVRDPSGRVVWKNKRTIYKVVKASPEYFSIVKEALRDVVKRGTAQLANSHIAEIAGKTGTAQVSPFSTGRKHLPYHLRDHAWFVGFAPYRDPIFLIGVLIEHGGSGGGTAAPLARAVLERIYMEGINREFI
ncbi:penicillin-binding protein 2 [Hydrogenobacter thermophilus]|uniref:penicillin-binding protein 2 n=1 Tax=Hydrogenobacter thermophilus TaxID=940 RepID=UPI0030FC8847